MMQKKTDIVMDKEKIVITDLVIHAHQFDN
jgi:hypothetical protein